MAKKDAAAEVVDFTEGDSLMVDFNEVEDVTFEAMPRGLYDCIISENEFTYSQSKGNPMWSLQYEVEGGEYAGRKLFSHMVMVGAGLPITKRHLSRVAPELLEGPFDPEDDDVIQSLVGRRVCLKVNQRKYEGDWRNNVQDVLPAREATDSFA